MKKGNRWLALFLIIVLTATSIVWDFSNTRAADAQGTDAAVSPHVKYDFESMTDVSVLEQDFESWKQGAIEKDASIADYWFLGKTAEGAASSEVNGLKVKERTPGSAAVYRYLKHKNTYTNFHVTVELYPDANTYVNIGHEPDDGGPATGNSDAFMLWFSSPTQGNWRGGGRAQESSTSKGYTFKKNTPYTFHIRVEDGKLSAWFEEIDWSTSFSLGTAFESPSSICLRQRRNYDSATSGGMNGGFKSLEIRNLDAEGYYDFEGADVSKLTDFTASQQNKTSGTFTKKNVKASELWYSGKSATSADKIANTSTNNGLKPLSNTNTDNSYEYYLNYKNSYESYKATVELYKGSNIGFILGESNVMPGGSPDANGIMIWFPNNTFAIQGALDWSDYTYTENGVEKSTASKNNLRNIKYSSGKVDDGTLLTAEIEVKDGYLTISVGYSTLRVKLSSSFLKNSSVVFWNRNYKSNNGGFKSFEIEKISVNTGTTVDVDGYTDFDKVNVAVLDEKGFTATQFDSANNYSVVGEVNQPVATYWAAGSDVPSQNDGLKPKTKESDSKMTILNTPYDYQNFKISTQVYWGTNTGVVLGAENVFPTSETDSSVRIYFNANQIQLAGGGLDYSVKDVTGGGSWNAGYAPTYIFKPSSSFTIAKGEAYTLNVELLDGVLTVWVDGYDGVVSIKVADTFKNESIALMARQYDGDGGGLKSFKIEELDSVVKPQAVQAQVGEGFEEQFLPSDTAFKISDLEDDFSSYYYAADATEPERDKLSFRWADTNWGLRPTHNRASGADTLLTYDRLIFKNVEVTTKYQRNWGQYAIMIAPQGELATVENHGIMAWVESEGRIRVTGAIDAGSAASTGGYVTVLGQNMIAGYNIPDYASKATDKFYNLHLKIQGEFLYIWMDEVPDYVISVKVTKDYQGGLVSLYSDGNNDGGYGSFTAVELEDPNTTTTAYEQSFNTINSLDELTDFTAYSLDSVANQPTEVNIADAFQLQNGKLQATSAENGKDDRTNFSILTLNNKKYENFELTLKYEQARMQRYGIMFGTELGEFAYSLSNSRLSGNGGTYVYTEAEGYRNVRGSMYASSYTKASEALHRETGKPDSFWWYNDDVMNNVQRKTLHTMTVRVVDGYMTMVIDYDESTRMTVRLADYEGGYISLVSDAAAGDYGSFLYLAIEELDENAELETTLPELSDGFETLKEVDEIFDAYYLADAKKSSKLEKVNLKEHWWLNNEGFLARAKSASGYSVTEDVEVLTYTKEKFTDFEMTYTYQQNWLRLGIMLGEDLGEYALSYKDGKLTADRGALYYLEAEGYSNAQGYLNNMTDKDNLKYRVTKFAPVGFKDTTGNVTANISAKKEHLVKVVVKDKQLYVFIDGNEEEAALHVYLGDNYKGGYVSLIAHSASGYGFNNFTITDKVTTKLPTGKGTSTSENTFAVDFDTTKLDISQFETYYLAKTKGNETGAMEKDTFEDQWTLDNGHLESNNQLTSPSSKNLEEFEYDDSTMVSVLTYKKKLTDFVVSYDYQKTPQRLMFMFGTEMGKFALAAPNTTQQAQGVLLYPENDLGVSGGLVALGNLATYNSSMRPINRQKVSVDGYHIKDKWASNVGTWHTMTVAVIEGHCYVYLDDYGMIADYELSDYEGGYISLATTGRSGGFDNLKITDLSTLSENDIIAGENPSDITVLVGTDVSALGLPTSVKATTKIGNTVDVPVTWKSLNYNPNEAGVYQFTAILDEKTNVGVKINIRVVAEMPTTPSNVKYWTFDTEDDLKDFKAYYLKNVDSGYITEDVPNWYVSSSGKLTRDPFRAVNGDQYKELAILTYAKEKYTNFELEVEYTQQWQRMMVLFGSEKVGQYIDLKDIYAASNPVAGYVEMEGVRNFIGNLINANFDSNDEEKINNARESGVRIENYYDEVLSGGNQGKKHTMKIRVVGDQAMMWVDGSEVPYVCTLTNYDGGYISLVMTSKNGSFDNLKITRLGATPEEVVEDPNAVANGTMNVSVDEAASTELVVPEREKPESYEDVSIGVEKKIVIPTLAYVVGGTTILLAAVIGGLFILTAVKKKKKES